MKNRIVVITLALVCAMCAFGQTTNAARPIVGFVGSEYKSGGSPKATMVLGGLLPIGDTDFAGAAADLAFKPNQQPAITIRPEYIKYAGSVTVGSVKLPVYAIIGLGVQFQASDPMAVITQLKAALSNVGTNVGYNAAVGVTTNFSVGKVHFSPAFRVVKGSLNDTQYVAGVTIPFDLKVGK
ncbi:MAG: hypothetical protein KGL39_45230 [Patescibacteria group bacterium]|nr:hypothetical protein [Patescibacteria group bacterium]